MTELNVFETYKSKDFNVYFQEEAVLEEQVDIRYVKYGREDIKNYVDNVSKPEIYDYVNNQKNSITN